jgi:hypothetical protein
MSKIETQHYNWVLWTYWEWDWIAWWNSPLKPEKRNMTWDWKMYAPEHEIQFINWKLDPFETSFCVTFSALDSIETEFNYLLANWLVPQEDVKWLNNNWYFKNWKINLSDRFTWILWETTKTWAYLFKIARAIIDYWLIPENMLPLNVDTYEEFVDKTKITDKMYEVWREFNKRFIINYEWITLDNSPISKNDLKENLKVSPMQCVVRYDDWDWILNPSWMLNHAVMCNWYHESSDAEDINDSYWREQKRYSREHPRSYLQFYITFKNKEINMDKVKFYKDNDQKWVRNINTGAFWKVLKWKLYVADTKDRMVLMLVDEAHRSNWVSVTDVEWQTLDKVTF